MLELILIGSPYQLLTALSRLQFKQDYKYKIFLIRANNKQLYQYIKEFLPKNSSYFILYTRYSFLIFIPLLLISHKIVVGDILNTWMKFFIKLTNKRIDILEDGSSLHIDNDLIQQTIIRTSATVDTIWHFLDNINRLNFKKSVKLPLYKDLLDAHSRCNSLPSYIGLVTIFGSPMSSFYDFDQRDYTNKIKLLTSGYKANTINYFCHPREIIDNYLKLNFNLINTNGIDVLLISKTFDDNRYNDHTIISAPSTSLALLAESGYLYKKRIKVLLLDYSKFISDLDHIKRSINEVQFIEKFLRKYNVTYSIH